MENGKFWKDKYLALTKQVKTEREKQIAWNSAINNAVIIDNDKPTEEIIKKAETLYEIIKRGAPDKEDVFMPWRDFNKLIQDILEGNEINATNFDEESFSPSQWVLYGIVNRAANRGRRDYKLKENK